MNKKNNIVLQVQINCKNIENIPKKHIFLKWIEKVLHKKKMFILLQLEL
ncbi:hypothetical protein [Buchnera aphidicola]